MNGYPPPFLFGNHISPSSAEINLVVHEHKIKITKTIWCTPIIILLQSENKTIFLALSVTCINLKRKQENQMVLEWGFMIFNGSGSC